jgi:ribonuclease D
MAGRDPEDKETPEYRWARDSASLRELAQQMERHPEHALDSESNSGFAYRERLCLLQVNVEGNLWLVDLMALGEGPDSIDPLRPPLEAADTTTLLHGGEFDVGSFKRDYELQLGGVWDSQQATSFLGWEKTGYGSVVERVCGIELEKAYAHHDWGKRPIREEALEYALNDVRYLPEVASALREEIRQADLEEELEVANQAVMSATWSEPRGLVGIWRVKGVRELDPGALSRLVALWEWREAEAKVANVPPSRLVHPEQLLALAKRSGGRGRLELRGRLARYRDDIRKALDQAPDRPPSVPQPERGRAQSPGEGRRIKRLKHWRRQEAQRRGVPQPVVLPPTAMQYLARNGCDDLTSVPQLGEKRIRLYEQDFQRLCS